MTLDANLQFLQGGGEMGELIRSHDWSTNPLGLPSTWTQSLRTAVRLMLSSQHPMYIFWGAEGVCLYNDGFRPSIGADRHPSSLGGCAKDVWQEIWSVVGPQLAQVMSGGKPTWHENQPVPMTRNGTLVNVYWTYGYSPIDDERAPFGVGGALVICNETTQHVEMLRQHAANEQRLQLALSAGRGVGTWDWDVRGDVVVADERFANLYGIDPAEAKRGASIDKFFAAVHPDDRQRMRARVDEALSTGKPFSAEYRLTLGGATRWVVAEGRCEFDSAGQPTRFAGITFDITDRKDAEERLRDLNADLERKVIERSLARGRTWQINPDLQGALNSQGYFETSNPAWQTVLGLSEQEVASTSIFDLLHPDDVDRTRLGFESVKKGQPVVRFPNRYRHKDGSYRWISWVAIPEDGMVYCSGRDITEELQNADALQHTQDALRQSQKMDALGQLTGGIAHDFNNMLQGIVSPLQLIRKRIETKRLDDLDRYIQASLDSARRAAAVTQRLLAFSRRQPLDNRAVNLADALHHLQPMFANAVGENRQVTVAAQEGLWNAQTDAHQFDNAVLNLVINARDALPHGGDIEVDVRNAPMTAVDVRDIDGLSPGDYLRVTVSDSGVGIPAHILAQVFEPFFTTKPLGQGTGLGLSMIYGYARQSRGAAVIRSIESAGTKVMLYLPRATSDAQVHAPVPSTPTAAVPACKRIVVVEDDLVVRNSVVELLRDQQYEVLEAVDGASAMRLLQDIASIDLLLSDVGLPGPNGRQVADFALERFPDVKIILMTGYAARVATEHDLLRGNAALLVKPFDADALLTRVAACWLPTA